MGYDLSIRVTPYVDVPMQINKDVVKVKRFCTEHPKIKQEKNKFCSECGKAITQEDYVVNEKISTNRILIEYDTLWMPESSSFFIPNSNPPKNIKVDEYESCAVDFMNISDLVSEQLTWFNSKYSKELSILRKNLGEDNVKVKWGVVTYWS